MKTTAQNLTNKKIPALAAFIPFSAQLILIFESIMPLTWIILSTALSAIALISIYLNMLANDFFWAGLGVWAYTVISISVYTNIINRRDVIEVEQPKRDFNFSNLTKTCASAVFSDYRISFLSKIPLVLQVLAGGSLLYEVFGADWILHALAGFGIGAMALKAYLTGINTYGYSRLALYFHIGRLNAFKTERKHALAEFTIFSVLFFAIPWEIFERTVHYISPENIFRIGSESIWNITGDVVSAVLGGMLALYLLKMKLKLL